MFFKFYEYVHDMNDEEYLISQKLNNERNMQGQNKEHQAVTVGIFYCRDSASFSVSASN